MFFQPDVHLIVLFWGCFEKHGGIYLFPIAYSSNWILALEAVHHVVGTYLAVLRAEINVVSRYEQHAIVGSDRLAYCIAWNEFNLLFVNDSGFCSVFRNNGSVVSLDSTATTALSR